MTTVNMKVKILKTIEPYLRGGINHPLTLK